MANDLHAFAQRLNTAATAMSGAPLREVMTKVGVAGKKDLEQVVARDAGGDMAMHNWKRAKLTTGFEHTGEGQITFRPRPAGPWRVLSEGANKHTIGQKQRGRGKNRRTVGKLLNTPYGPRPFVVVPRKKQKTRGHDTWDKGVAKVKSESHDRISREVRGVLGKVIGG